MRSGDPEFSDTYMYEVTTKGTGQQPDYTLSPVGGQQCYEHSMALSSRKHHLFDVVCVNNTCSKSTK